MRSLFAAGRYDRAALWVQSGVKAPGVLLGARDRGSRSGADRRAGSSSHGPPADAEGSRSHYRGGQTGMAVHASLYVPSGRRSRNRWSAASMSRRRVELFSIVNLFYEPRTAPCRLLLLALSRHVRRRSRCPLAGVKRTSCGQVAMSAFDPKGTSGASESRWIRCSIRAFECAFWRMG